MIQLLVTRNGVTTIQPVDDSYTQKEDVLDSYRLVAGMVRGVTITDIRDTNDVLIGFTSTTKSGRETRFEVQEVEAEVKTA